MSTWRARTIDALREGGARFVLCPRSNAAHGNGAPDVTHFVDAGIPFALGTDSLGSVPDLDLWEEIRCARSLYKGKMDDAALCRELLRAATANGAAALSAFPAGRSPRAPRRISPSWTIPAARATGFFRKLVETDGPVERAPDRRRRTGRARGRRVKRDPFRGMADKTETEPGVKVVATNRRARHEYEILETFECGLALQGYEVKSIREGRVNIADGFASFRENEVFVENMHITPYSHGDLRVIDPLRVRKLLLKRKEIDYLHRQGQGAGVLRHPAEALLQGAAGQAGGGAGPREEALRQAARHRGTGRPARHRARRPRTAGNGTSTGSDHIFSSNRGIGTFPAVRVSNK